MQKFQGKKKILIAVGGTGGHLFPAQAMAEQLLEKMPGISLLFAGSHLESNSYLKKTSFPYKEISSGTLFRKNALKNLIGIFNLIRGIKQSLSLIKEFSPDLVVGFGSFHSFPLILAAQFTKTPFVLYDSNAVPGKVNRFFSKRAQVSALQFEEAKRYVIGKTELVNMPFMKPATHLMHFTASDAKRYYGLEPHLPTLLVFGGSQGAGAINRLISSLQLIHSFQLLHFTGNPAQAEEVKEIYKKRGILAAVKSFENQMYIAWKAANLAICRSGAGTFAEILAYEVPAILIPYPFAADNHQQKNAEVLEKAIGGGICIAEKELTTEKLSSLINEMIDPKQGRLVEMKKNIASYKKQNQKKELSNIILDQIGKVK